MPITALRFVRDGDGDGDGDGDESLTLVILAMLAGAGHDSCYDEINAALGTSFVIWAGDPSTSVAQWTSHGRDAHLSEVSTLFGIRLRELHPRQAARGLDASPEYMQHFVDSYRPLIFRALRNDQPVIAWCGWAGASTTSWGLVTAEHECSIGLAGLVASSEGLVPMRSPAYQCYVVEEVAPRRPDALSVLRCALNAPCIREIDGSSASSAGLVCGTVAYDRWLERLETDAPEQFAQGHHAHAASVRANRESAVRYLRAVRPSVARPKQTDVDLLIAGCQAAAGALSSVEASCGGRWADGRHDAVEHLLSARQADIEAWQLMGGLANSLNEAHRQT